MKKLHFILFCFVAALTACNHGHDDHSHPADTAAVADSSHAHHHNMMSMEMSSTNTSNQPADHSDMLVLTAHEQLLAGISFDTVRLSSMNNKLSVLGVVAIDESSLHMISAAYDGRVDRLYVKNPGELVHKGQLLYEIYSETILGEEQQLLQMIASSAGATLIKAAEDKLLLHGLTNEQVRKLETNKDASGIVRVFSPVDGFLSGLKILEGGQVNAGSVIYEIASLDVVRVNAQLYSDEIILFSNASDYTVESNNLNRSFTATKAFENPTVESSSKIYNLRLRVINSEHLLKPGMMTSVRLNAQSVSAITVPSTAVQKEGNMEYIWVLERDGMFSRRMITTGNTIGNSVQVTGGILAGEIIVVNGNYLLNSEYILRKGANSMGGMKM